MSVAPPSATFMTETLVTSQLDRQRLAAINETTPQHHPHPSSIPTTAAPTPSPAPAASASASHHHHHHHLSAQGLSTATSLVTSLLSSCPEPEHLTESEIKARVRAMLQASISHDSNVDVRDGVTEEASLSAAYWDKLGTCVLPMR